MAGLAVQARVAIDADADLRQPAGVLQARARRDAGNIGRTASDNLPGRHLSHRRAGHCQRHENG